MRDNTRHIRWILGMATMLLCFVVCRMDMAGGMATDEPVGQTAYAMSEDCNATDATLIEKEDDMFHAAQEMGSLGIPSASITLQGAAGRTLNIGKTLQRINRISNAFYVDESRHTHEWDEALHHTLQTKRFQTGYYIYYRCQMRC